jgi:ribonuclease III
MRDVFSKQMKKKEILTLSQLEEAIGYTFQDKSLLERSLTHRSWAHEQVQSGEEIKARHLHNEALEFMGDSVLGLIVAEHLFLNFPDLNEGALSRMKHMLVSTSSLAIASERMDIGRFVRVGLGEERSGGRRKQAILADVFEAILAAIFLDGGLPAARSFVNKALEEELRTADPTLAAAADHKTMLQEILQARKVSVPHYKVIEVSGPPHSRNFLVEVTWDGGSVRGSGATIKAAQMEAAKHALLMINS